MCPAPYLRAGQRRISSNELRTKLGVTSPKSRVLSYKRMGRVHCLPGSPGLSRARASAESDPPEVNQGGPQRLRNALARTRNRLDTERSLPLLKTRVLITPEGDCRLLTSGPGRSAGRRFEVRDANPVNSCCYGEEL